jgi:hypothetical protein
MRMMKMNVKEVEELVKTLNERFINEQKETLEKVKEMLDERDNPKSGGSYDDGFHKVSHYLSMLIDVTSRTDHKLHTEIDEAVKKLKEMAYQG